MKQQDDSANAALARCFQRCGYIRFQDYDRLSREGYLGHRKGDEVRLTLKDAHEFEEIRRLQIDASLNKSGGPLVPLPA